jgi:pyruvate,water dikinase
MVLVGQASHWNTIERAQWFNEFLPLLSCFPLPNLRLMSPYVIDIREIDSTTIVVAGGKGANLGEISRIDGIHVPDGFCISTEAFKRMLDETPEMDDLLLRLSSLTTGDRHKISELSGEIRRCIEGIAIPGDIIEEITRFLTRFGAEDAYAVRSSATAEDLPTASFAGQQDTYLNVIGKQAILQQTSKCWASLFTDRAVLYRLQNGFDHRKVQLAVLVQKMVFAQTAGVLFTADPATSNRKVAAINASFGLGEALVSGLVNADSYTVRDGKVIDKKIPAKKLAIYALAGGGTEQREIAPETQNRPALTDEQILELERLGRKIEEHFGRPQDIEWCLADGAFYIVQSRPITTLFPVPEANDRENHVYVSVGHQQMMTDAMKPLGLSVFLLTAARPMDIAGGRLFVDVARDLASPERREMIVGVLGKSDPLLRDALMTIVERDGFVTPAPDDGKEQRDFRALTEYAPSDVSALIDSHQAGIEEVKSYIPSKSGLDLMNFILDDIQKLKKSLSDPKSFGVIMTAMNASAWINERMNEWLGEKNAADTLAQSVPNNITAEMGLALLEVADVIRPYPEVIGFLQQVREDSFLDTLATLKGGAETRNAIYGFLDKYGMRCAGEIDITRARWSERPATLIPMILTNVRDLQPGFGKRKFEQGLQEALKKEQELLGRLRQLPDGRQKAEDTKRMIRLIRDLSGYREYPKYAIVNRYFIYKQALLKEAERLVRANLIGKKEDIYYLTFEELREAIGSHKVNREIIEKRKADYTSYKKLTPPRVITSDGEIITGRYKRQGLPAGAIAGLPVSSGVVEGRARVIVKMEDAELEAGDILVTPFTDPSWTPLFVAIKGLVTEVGGLMTHGAVIAREYGLPAIVGVENATRLIIDGQRIRVNGTEGYLEIL